MEDLNNLYLKNDVFKRYVDRYARDHSISQVEAVQHSMVREYARYITSPEYDKDSLSNSVEGNSSMYCSDRLGG